MEYFGLKQGLVGIPIVEASPCLWPHLYLTYL